MLFNFTSQILNEFNLGIVYLVLTGSFALLYFSMSAGLNFFFNWTLKKQWTEKVINLSLFKNQLRFEIIHSFMSIAVFGIYGALIVLCYRNEVVHISFNNDYMVLVGLIILAIWNEVHFYFCHRLMHTKLFLKIHQTHHKSHVVTPFSTYSFHPIESLIFGSVMILPMLLIDFEALALLIFPIYHLFFNTLGHSNVKLKKHHSGVKNIEISTQHNNHHTTYNSNFGFVTRIMDQIVGTYHKKLK